MTKAGNTSLKIIKLFFLFLPLAACNTHTRTGVSSNNSELHRYVDASAREHNVPRKIAHAVVTVESNYNCNARNKRSGALGPMQVLPATARSMGVTGNLTHCKTGVDAGMRYLKQALEKGGKSCEGVSLYERGVYASPVCSAYGKKVMNIANNIRDTALSDPHSMRN